MSSDFKLPPGSGIGFQAAGFSLAGPAVGGSSETVFAARLPTFARIRTDASPFGIVNDYVATRLGMAIGAPVPDGNLIALGKQYYAFYSTAFGERGTRLPPADLESLARDCPFEATGIIALDQLILNQDRTDENLAYQESMGVAAFDHDWSMLGQNPPDPFDCLRKGRDMRINGHPLAEWLTTDIYFESWVQRVRSVRPEEIHRIVAKCVHAELLSRDLASTLVDFLLYRQSNIARYIEETRSDLSRLQVLGLPNSEVEDDD